MTDYAPFPAKPARNEKLHGDGVVATAGRNTFIEPVCVVDAGHVAFNAGSGALRNINGVTAICKGSRVSHWTSVYRD